MVSVGICLRNDKSGLLQAKITQHKPILQVHEGEAIELIEAMKWVASLGLDNVIFE